MKHLILIFSAVLGLFSGAFAAVNAMNGTTVSTSSTVMGVTPNSAVMGQTLVGGSGTATATDNFTRANADPISNPMSDGVATWQTSNVGGSGGHLQIGANQASGTDTSDNNIARVATPTFTGQHKSTITVPTGGISGSTYTGPAVRVQSSSDASCYLALVNASTTDIEIDKCTDLAGSITRVALGSNFTVTALVPGDTITLGVSGTTTVTLTLFINGVSQGTRTDSVTPFTGGQPGMFCYGTYPLAQGFNAVDY